MFDDFNINKEELPPELPDPSNTREDLVYKSYVQRLMCSVPRAEALRGRMNESSKSLRVRQ